MNYVLLDPSIPFSSRWLELPRSSANVYLAILSKFDLHNPISVSFTYKEAESKLNMSRAGFSRSVTRLLKDGFIFVVQRGGPGRKKSLYYPSWSIQLIEKSQFKLLQEAPIKSPELDFDKVLKIIQTILPLIPGI